MTFYSFLKKHCLKSWGIHLDLSLPVRSFLFNLIFQPFKTHPIIKWEGNNFVIDWPIKLIPLYFELFSLHYSVLTRQAASVFRQPRCSSSPGQLVLQLSAVRMLHMLVPAELLVYFSIRSVFCNEFLPCLFWCLNFATTNVWYVVLTISNSDIFTPDNAMTPYLRRRVAGTSSILLTTRGIVTSSVM